jgi:hypothetical protein
VPAAAKLAAALREEPGDEAGGPPQPGEVEGGAEAAEGEEELEEEQGCGVQPAVDNSVWGEAHTALLAAAERGNGSEAARLLRLGVSPNTLRTGWQGYGSTLPSWTTSPPRCACSRCYWSTAWPCSTHS